MTSREVEARGLGYFTTIDLVGIGTCPDLATPP
jgi:hypothetical protein